jgi:hypothetical protein
MFARVFRETGIRFVFEVRGLRLDGDLLSFYIKPEDGLELPEIMKWMKQVFAQRYNRAEGRTGHIWGDRYWSRIVEEEVVPQASREGKGHGISALLKFHGVRPRYDGRGRGAGFFLIFPHPAAPSPE